MEQVKSIIIGRNILDNIWLKVILAMTHISNLLPISLLNSLSSYKNSTGLSLKLNHLRVLRSTVYVFVYKKNGRPSLLNGSYKQNAEY